jgi:hypothetical protein
MEVSSELKMPLNETISSKMKKKIVDDRISWIPFRAEYSEDNRKGFNRHGQIEMCAHQLLALRNQLGERWGDLCGTAYRCQGLGQAKKLAKHLIRVASESTDHLCTVDFVSVGAVQELTFLRDEHPKKQALQGHLADSLRLTHEHMVPGDVVIKELTSRRTKDSVEYYIELLEAYSYRALISKALSATDQSAESDITRLDKKYKQRLPVLQETSFAKLGHNNLRELPFRFHPLLRYDAAGLLDQLIPVSARAKRLISDYLSPEPPC